ncbi:hypothetical protein PsWM33_02797 [Pseudovibrio sp. WM33]|nr:hypothetical protein PsWM33_02797 [Pseudovibrio sp. WM33]
MTTGPKGQPAPRLMTKAQAADYCGLKPSTFSKWVKSGRLLEALLQSHRWDKLAIDKALDMLSGIVSQEPEAPETAFDRWLSEVSKVA